MRQYLDKFKPMKKFISSVALAGGHATQLAPSTTGLKNIICVPTTGMLHWDQAGYPVN